MSRLLPSLLALALAGGAAHNADAQLYRWIDERGAVNYGDTPPPNARQITPLNPDRSGVSVVPGLSREELDRAKKSAEQARIERLEREVKSLREEARNRPPPAPTPPATEPSTVYVPVYPAPPRPRPWPKPPRPEPVEPPPPPPPPLYTRPK